MRKVKRKRNIHKRIIITILFIFLSFCVLCASGYVYYKKVLEKNLSITLELIGEKNITLEYGNTYEDEGAKAYFNNEDITKSIKINNKVNYDKIGSYKIDYIVKVRKKTKKISRNIEIIDKEKPVIRLKGSREVIFNLNEDYKDPGFTAVDNYDGNITSKVKVTNNINKEVIGTYEIIYKVSDSSGNEYKINRYVRYVEPLKPLPGIKEKAKSIAVLNYHFFYDPANKESGSDSNFISVQNFEEQLKYLNDNEYKTLTMDEFRKWMYGEIELPARSVLLTVDDGAKGTGKHNGNKLIPLLEKYQAHATLFLITGWWDIDNYSSPYLDIESHSHDLHHENVCAGVSRGAKILCISDEEVLNDLEASINITGSTNAFCYPFYVYNAHTIELVQQAGFKLAFVGGEYKATRSTNKYKIPRYHVYKNTSIVKFNNMIA